MLGPRPCSAFCLGTVFQGGSRPPRGPRAATLGARHAQRWQRAQGGPRPGAARPEPPAAGGRPPHVPGPWPAGPAWVCAAAQLTRSRGPLGGYLCWSRVSLCVCVPICPCTHAGACDSHAHGVCVCPVCWVCPRGLSVGRESVTKEELSTQRGVHVYGVRVCGRVLVHGGPPRPTSPVASGQHSFALVHEVAGDVAQDEDGPEEGHSAQQLHGGAQLAGAQLPGEPRVRSAGP